MNKWQTFSTAMFSLFATSLAIIYFFSGLSPEHIAFLKIDKGSLSFNFIAVLFAASMQFFLGISALFISMKNNEKDSSGKGDSLLILIALIAMLPTAGAIIDFFSSLHPEGPNAVVSGAIVGSLGFLLLSFIKSR